MKKVFLLLAAVFFLISIGKGIAESRHRRRGVLAIVTVSGVIRGDTGSGSWPTGRAAEETAQQLHKLSEDADVKAIVLRINSPGGTVGSVQEIHREMARCRAQGKKIIASLGDIAASGGYYLAAGADHIVANPGTITGSIGVILKFSNMEALFQKVGFKLQVIKSGIHKDMGSPARALTPEEKALLQDSIDDAYAQFVDAVREGRKLTPDQMKNLADGRIFTGRQAMKAGLIDEMGNLEDAIQTAIRLAKLPAKPFILSDKRRSLSSLMDRVSSASVSSWDSFQQSALGASVEYQWRP